MLIRLYPCINSSGTIKGTSAAKFESWDSEVPYAGRHTEWEEGSLQDAEGHLRCLSPLPLPTSCIYLLKLRVR